jgi:hypothetical protein
MSSGSDSMSMKLHEPCRVVALVKLADQGGTVGIGTGEDVEQLAGARFAEVS